MKQSVKFSTYSILLTCLSLAVTVFFCVYWFDKSGKEFWAWTLLVLMVVLCSSALYFAPNAVSADDKQLTVHRLLRDRKIPYGEISSIRLYPPTMAEKRLLGSGGCFGYWGWFADREIGKYFAYYGKASDCFLVTLKDDRQYIIGCNNPGQMVDYISERL